MLNSWKETYKTDQKKGEVRTLVAGVEKKILSLEKRRRYTRLGRFPVLGKVHETVWTACGTLTAPSSGHLDMRGGGTDVEQRERILDDVLQLLNY